MFELGIPDRNAALLAVAALHRGVSVIRVYGNNAAMPSSPGDAIGAATLLAVFTEADDGSTGLSMALTAANGVLLKDSGEVWMATVIANGTATFYRKSALADAGGASITEPRVQGSVGVVNADLLFSTVDWIIGDEKRIDSYAWGQPEQAAA
ncbi:MAG TPA: hypothetical protein DCZ63_15180 [Geobacter sp.]|nr:hypothetical protein [Geobacter sp.]